MKIAYLIIAHKNPKLLAREIATLSSPDSAFYLHIDAKSEIEQFEGLRADNVHFLEERLTISWAGFSIVRAVLLLISAALESGVSYDYFVLLGGSEYPLRSANYIHNFLEAHRGAEFIDLVKLPNELAGKPLTHVTKFCFENRTPVHRLGSKLVSRLGMFRRDYRKHLGKLEPYGGEMWWALTREACAYIREFVDRELQVVRFFQNVPVPDETFLQTILGNSPFAAHVKRNLLYRDWSGGGAHPAMITAEHIRGFATTEKVMLNDAFGEGEALFARKFSDATLHLVDEVDGMVANKEQALAEQLL